MTKWILVGKEAVPCDSVEEWGRWYETADRRVAKDWVNGMLVSTVFLGLDHNWGGGTPLLFETMVFPEGSCDERYMERYETWEEAEVGHGRAIAWVLSRYPTLLEDKSKDQENSRGGGDDLT